VTPGVQIVRDKDADGFYVGELGGRRGLVPSNMVSPVDDRTTPGVNNVVGSSRLADSGGGGGDTARGGASTGRAVSPPSPRRHHRHNGRTFEHSTHVALGRERECEVEFSDRITRNLFVL